MAYFDLGFVNVVLFYIFMHYTQSGKEKGNEIWRSDLKCSSLCAACVLCMWTDRYDVRRTVAYFQESFIKLSNIKLIGLSVKLRDRRVDH